MNAQEEPEASLTPCVVVIDSRNVIGQATRMFGVPATVDVGGIRSILRNYGFEPVEIYVGMATRLLQEKATTKVQEMHERNLALASDLRAQGAVILEGYLAERPQLVEEKQVDVLCAVKIVDAAVRIAAKVSQAKCVVSFSEDMDLMPAYQAARDLNIPVFTAASESVHTRETDGWILLDEQAIEACSSVRSNVNRLALRQKLARIATSDIQERRICRVEGGGKPISGQITEWRVSANSGARGVYRTSESLAHRERIPLYVKSFEKKRSSKRLEMPRLVFTRDAVQGPLPNVQVGTLTHWQFQNRAKVALDDGHEVAVGVPLGAAVVGQRVVLVAGLETLIPDGENCRSWHFVGADPSDTDRLKPRRRRVEVLSWTDGSAWADARCLESNVSVRLAVKHITPVVGGIFNCVDVEVPSTGAAPVAYPVSTNVAV